MKYKRPVPVQNNFCFHPKMNIKHFSDLPNCDYLLLTTPYCKSYFIFCSSEIKTFANEMVFTQPYQKRFIQRLKSSIHNFPDYSRSRPELSGPADRQQLHVRPVSGPTRNRFEPVSPGRLLVDRDSDVGLLRQ